MTNQLEAKHPSHVKVATVSLIGTAIEWYDFFLYGTAAALIFNKLFFPTFDPSIRARVWVPLHPRKRPNHCLAKRMFSSREQAQECCGSVVIWAVVPCKLT